MKGIKDYFKGLLMYIGIVSVALLAWAVNWVWGLYEH